MMLFRYSLLLLLLVSFSSYGRVGFVHVDSNGVVHYADSYSVDHVSTAVYEIELLPAQLIGTVIPKAIKPLRREGGIRYIRTSNQRRAASALGIGRSGVQGLGGRSRHRSSIVIHH